MKQIFKTYSLKGATILFIGLSVFGVRTKTSAFQTIKLEQTGQIEQLPQSVIEMGKSGAVIVTADNTQPTASPPPTRVTDKQPPKINIPAKPSSPPPSSTSTAAPTTNTTTPAVILPPTSSGSGTPPANTSPAPAQPAPASPPTPPPPPPPSPVYKFKDGTYYAQGNYSAPSGNEAIGVSLVVSGDVITDSTVTALSSNGTSRSYQIDFINTYKPSVVGKKLDQVQLGKTSISSLTPIGFNNAVNAIEAVALN